MPAIEIVHVCYDYFVCLYIVRTALVIDHSETKRLPVARLSVVSAFGIAKLQWRIWILRLKCKVVDMNKLQLYRR
jgi:hypothetical protein